MQSVLPAQEPPLTSALAAGLSCASTTRKRAICVALCFVSRVCPCTKRSTRSQPRRIMVRTENERAPKQGNSLFPDQCSDPAQDQNEEQHSAADKQYEFDQEIWFHQLVSPHRNHPRSAFRENEMQDEHLLLLLFSLRGAEKHDQVLPSTRTTFWTTVWYFLDAH